MTTWSNYHFICNRDERLHQAYILSVSSLILMHVSNYLLYIIAALNLLLSLIASSVSLQLWFPWQSLLFLGVKLLLNVISLPITWDGCEILQDQLHLMELDNEQRTWLGVEFETPGAKRNYRYHTWSSMFHSIYSCDRLPLMVSKKNLAYWAFWSKYRTCLNCPSLIFTQKTSKGLQHHQQQQQQALCTRYCCIYLRLAYFSPKDPSRKA